jgi:hypothetical protein
VEYATTDDATTNTNSFHQQNQDDTTNTDATTNAEEYYLPTQQYRAHDVSGLPALNRASVITFSCALPCVCFLLV